MCFWGKFWFFAKNCLPKYAQTKLKFLDSNSTLYIKSGTSCTHYTSSRRNRKGRLAKSSDSFLNKKTADIFIYYNYCQLLPGQKQFRKFQIFNYYFFLYCTTVSKGPLLIIFVIKFNWANRVTIVKLWVEGTIFLRQTFSTPIFKPKL